MNLKTWTKSGIESYCNAIIRLKDVRAYYVPVSKTGCEALAFIGDRAIVYCRRKFSRSLLWHECGHLATCSKYNAKSKVNLKMATYWKYRCGDQFENEVGDIKDLGSIINNNEFVESEVSAQIWAIEKALEYGYTNVAREVFDQFKKLEGKGSLYGKSQELIRKRLEERKIKI